MFAAIYYFKVKPGQEEQFKESWKELTKLIYRHENSHGSRLHHSNGQEYIAYAVWPDFETWDYFGNKLPPESKDWSKQMKDSCEEIKTLHKLEVLDDLLKDGPFSGD